jgi:hypothetical protein
MAKYQKRVTITNEMWHQLKSGEIPRGYKLEQLTIDAQICYWEARKRVLGQRDPNTLTPSERADRRRADNNIPQLREFKRMLKRTKESK